MVYSPPTEMRERSIEYAPEQIAVMARKSFAQASEKQKKSIEDQIAECLDVCSEHGFPTPAEENYYIEPKNHGGDEWWEAHPDKGLQAMPSERTRPVLTKLMLDVVSGRIKVIIVWNTDRVHRDVGIAKAFIDVLAAHGVRLFDNNGEVPLATPDSRAAYLNAAVAAQHYRETCARNSPRGILRSAKKGGLVTDANILGFRSGGRFTKIVVHVPEEQAKVNEIYDLCLAGLSYTQIAHKLHAEGYAWTPDLQQKRGKQRNEFTKDIIYDWMIKKVLTDARYVGKQLQYKQLWDCPAYLIDGVTNVIPIAKWEKVQAIIGMRSNGGGATRRHRPLTGLMKCGLCGQGLCVSATKVKRANGVCENIAYWKNVKNSADPCYWCTHSLPSLREEVVDAYVEGIFMPLVLAEIRDRVQLRENAIAAADTATLYRELREAERYYNEVLPTFNEITPRLLALKEQTCLKKIDELRQRLHEEEVRMEALDHLASPLAEYAALSPEQRRDALHAVVMWVAVLPSDGLRESVPGNSQQTRPPTDAGRLVFCTIFGTFHTAKIIRKFMPTWKIRQQFLEAAPFVECVPSIGCLPDPAGFLAGLERSWRGGKYAHNPSTQWPEYKAAQRIAEFTLYDSDAEDGLAT